jgi:SAM-dependent methyltransferase
MPYLSDYPRYAWQLINGERTDGELRLAQWRERDLKPYLDLHTPIRILDLANGRLRPQYAILRSQGHQVYGVDIVNRPTLNWKDLAYQAARWIYSRRLAPGQHPGRPRTLVCSNVNWLPFPNQSFDLVTSIAAFEHFLDVPAVVAELHRVLRPGGMIWVSIHLFTSPSGGHNLSFTEIPLRHVPPGVDPWDHLRRRKLPFSVPLNEWRREQYLAAFNRHFSLVNHYPAAHEGEALLKPEIAAELAAYDREELTCHAYVIVARKD